MNSKYLVIKNTYKGGKEFTVQSEDIVDAINSYDDIAQDVFKENRTLELMNDVLKKMGDNICELNKQHQEDLQLASYIQRQFMPQITFSDNEYEAAAYYQPLNGVSGDFYEFFTAHQKQLIGLGLFDVAGHGIGSALITMVAKQLIQQPFWYFHKKNLPLSEVMHAYNIAFQIMLKNFDHYMTGLLVKTYPDAIEISSAGHTEPLIRRQMGYVEKVNEVYGKIKGSIIGIPEMLNKLQYCSKNIPIDKNDVVLLYTDGFTEAQNPEGVMYEEYIQGDFLSINQLEAGKILGELIEKFEFFLKGAPIRDDITVLILRKK